MKVLTFPDPVLRQKAEIVNVFDDELKTLVADMLETMYDAPGVGLAANQVGVLKRILVLDVEYQIEGDREENRKLVGQQPLVIVNPNIVEKNGQILFKEGCLSVPGFTEEVKRFEKIILRYQDINGDQHEMSATGLLSVAIQHEMDHLDGKLFIDRLSMIKRDMIKGKIKKERGKTFERSRFHVDL
jgi:peptide deformylase